MFAGIVSHLVGLVVVIGFGAIMIAAAAAFVIVLVQLLRDR